MRKGWFGWAIFLLLQLLIAPSRIVARILIATDLIRGFKTLLAWNALFYGIIFLGYYTFYRPSILSAYSEAYGILIFARINELVFAFYGDAIKRKIKGNKQRLLINSSQQMVLLSLAYFEVMCLFGALYFCIYLNIVGAFKDDFNESYEALYLSAMTITTTGYGDFVPKVGVSRFAAMYEALVGVVFIALALAAYLSDKDAADAPDPRPEVCRFPRDSGTS